MTDKRITDVIKAAPADTAPEAADILPFVDLSADRLEQVTFANLAGSAAFAAQYAPLAGDTKFIAAGQMSAAEGSPAFGSIPLGVGYPFVAMLFDAAADEAVVTTYDVPPGWASYAIDIVWTNAGGGAGNVRWYSDHDSLVAGAAPYSGLEVGYVIGVVAAPVADVVKVTRFGTSSKLGTVAARYTRLGAGDAADTLANDAAMFGVLLTRAS